MSEPPAAAAAAAAPRRPWLAWKWDPVVDPTATPNILDAPQDGFAHLSPSGVSYNPSWAASWAAKLKAMPTGQRGFIWRDFNNDVDPARNPADGQSLWWQHGLAGAANKTQHIASALKRAGVAHVDFVLMDFETGLSKSFLDKLNDSTLTAMARDPRYQKDITALQNQNLTETVGGDWPSPPQHHPTPLEIAHGAWDTDCCERHRPCYQC